MNCQLCGTKVKVVGHTTKHYEPVVDKEMIVNIIEQYATNKVEEYTITSTIGPETRNFNSSCHIDLTGLADAIISAMYGDRYLKEQMK